MAGLAADRAARGLILLLAATGLGACRESRPAAAPLTVMSFHLDGYFPDDRSGDGQVSDPKPEPEIQAVVETVLVERPDVLALQGIGDAGQLADLEQRLRARGWSYPYREHRPAAEGREHLAVLSRFPLRVVRAGEGETYRVAGEEVPFRRGILEFDVSLAGGIAMRCLLVHLKSRTYDPRGQTEMRRNEARLLRQRIRRAWEETGGGLLLVAGSLSDHPRSAAVRLVVDGRQPELHDLRPVDGWGASWTCSYPGEDRYERYDYLLVSGALARTVCRERTRLVRAPDGLPELRRRPLIAAFHLPR